MRVISRISHRDRHSGFTPYPRGAREIQQSRESSQRGSKVSARSSVPSDLRFWNLVKTNPFKTEEDARSAFSDFFGEEETASCASQRPRSSAREVDDYINLLYRDVGEQSKLSKTLQLAEVVADQHKREYHWGVESARQYDLSLPYVLDMVRHMYERYDTVSCYSMGMLEVGMIIYYLEPYTLGLDQKDQGCGTATVGGSRFEARVHLKGRFGIVVDKYVQSIKVAEIFTFGKEGLQSKNPKIWPEYVGLRAAEAKAFFNPSPHKALEVASSCCEIVPTSSVHLVTDKITLSNQILCAGWITADSLKRLRAMIRDTESC